MPQLDYVIKLIHGFNWHSPSWDLFIILFWLVASVIYAFAAGRGRILTVLMSIYMSRLIVLEAPFLSVEVGKKLPGTALSLQQLATFGILFIILFIFLGRYAFKTSADSRRMSSVAFSIVFAILQIGLLINIVIGYLPELYKVQLNPLIQFLFVRNPASFIWLILPVAFLIFLGRFVSERAEM